MNNDKNNDQKVIYFEDCDAFNGWLDKHANESEIWVGYFKKSTGHISMTWSESVDVALCFGWIDGIRKTVDEQRYKIRFTPRKTKSVWSAVNVNKVKTLITQNKMKPAGLHLFNQRSNEEGYTSAHRNVDLDVEYEQQINANQLAWQFFTGLAPSYKRDSIWWVMSAKRKETQIRRLDILISSAEAGLKIPMLRKK